MSDLDQNEPISVVDRSKWVWAVVVGIIILMVGTLYVTSDKKPNVSSVRAKHILITFDPGDTNDRASALDLIEDLRSRLESGESFSRLARQYSDDPGSAARGGDLGYAIKGTYEDAFEEYVWNAPIDELSEVIQTPHGFHLIVVEDRYLTETDAYEMELERRVREEHEVE